MSSCRIFCVCLGLVPVLASVAADRSAAAGAPGAGGAGGGGGAAAGAGGAPPSEASIGRWFDSPAYPYKVKLDAVANCRGGGGEKSGGAAVPTKLVGFTVTVGSKIGLLWVFSRDVTLESRGVILQSLPARKPEIPGCAPALQSKQLKTGDSARGVVVFEVPATFAGQPGDSVVLVYKATRWGGAPRVEIPVPACLGSCAQPGHTEKGAGKRRR